MFTNVQDIATYTLAGRATITLVSQRTQARYTYKIKQAKNRDTGEPENRWFVALLTGPDNESDYTYLGMISDERGFYLTSKSRYDIDALPVRGFAFFWRSILADRMPPQMEVRHEGACGRCGRKLTVPESIDRGIGPECAGRMGLA